MKRRPNFLIILIDDLRFDEFGAGGHPYMKTPNVDRIAREGVIFERAFHTTPICSPNRASTLTGQYASRHGIIDNVARDAASHRLPNYHLELQRLGYETAHIGKWHMGNDGQPRPGYDHWVSFDGHGRLQDPRLNENGRYAQHSGYITDILNAKALEFVNRRHDKPWSLFFAHKAVHPDAEQAADGTLSLVGYQPAARHAKLYEGCMFPKKPNMLAPAEVVKQKPAWAEAFELKKNERSQALLKPIHAGQQEEIRLRAAMMASVDEGIGMLFDTLERAGELDNTFILFFGDNGYFFGEHGLGPERRFAYEEGIRSPFVARYPGKIKPGTRVRELVICQDIAPTADPARRRQARLAGPGTLAAAFAGRKALGLAQVLSRRVLGGKRHAMADRHDLQGSSHRPPQVHPLGEPRLNGELDELYDLDRDPYELSNVIKRPAYRAVRDRLRRELRRLVADAGGL